MYDIAKGAKHKILGQGVEVEIKERDGKIHHRIKVGGYEHESHDYPKTLDNKETPQ